MLTQSEIQTAKASPELSVHYKEDATYVHVYHPNLYVRIVKPRESWQPGGRIDTITFKGKPIVNTDDPRFGIISVLNATNVAQTQLMFPATMSLVTAVGNDTNKLVLTLATSSITLFDGTGALPVNVAVEFTLYADIDNIFIWVTLDSTLTAWRLYSTIYGQSLGLLYFQNYEVKGTRNTVIGQGSLTGITSQDFIFTATHAQITVKNTTNNVAVTMFPLGLFPPMARVRDRPALTWIFFETMSSRTYDGSWCEWGQNIRNITYGTGIALHDANVLPQVVTPWLMPSAVPYGIMQSYDELPADTYDRIQPDPTTIGGIADAYTYWYWHEQNPEAKINLMLGLDMLADGYTPTEGGVDRSWEVHGDMRLANASIEWKNWLKSIEGTWIGYGIHAYHHDYPWMWEFSTVTNATWIDATWNQINEDVRAIGLKNQTWFKAAGYNMRPQGLDILIKYGMQGYDVNYDEPPTATAWYFHVDHQGRKLILFSDSLSPDGELSEGKSPSYIYNNLIKGNLTKLGLLSMSGHFINQTIYPEWKELFDSISAEFDIHCFLVEEIIDYWYNVLMPLKYTYNSTTITKNVNDPRLTFRLISSTIPTASGYRYDDTTFTLYSPDMETPTFPIYSHVGTNTTKAGAVCQFHSKWRDNENMSGYIFATNNAGTWRNETWTPWNPPQTPTWSNVTITLNSTVGMIVGYRFYANDTSNNWSDTGIRMITLTDDNSYIFSDGFESGDFRQWSGTHGVVEVVQSLVYNGSYAAKSTDLGFCSKDLGSGGYPDVYVMFYIRFPGLPNLESGVTFSAIFDTEWGGRVRVSIWRSEDGRMWWVLHCPSGNKAVKATILADTWYRIEFQRKTGDGNGVAKLWVDGNLILSSTTETITINGQHVYAGVSWTNSENFIAYFDNIIIDNTYGETVGFLLKDGFESGSFEAWDWTGGAPEVVNTTSHNGTYSLKADAEFDYAAKAGLSQSDTIYVRGYFKFSALPNDEEYVLPLVCRNSEGTIVCGFEFHNVGGTQKIVLIDMTTWESSEYTATLNVDTWYCFEIKYYKHAIEGELRLYIDGVECCTLLNRQFNDRVDKINVGWIWGDYTGIIYADCIVVSDAYVGVLCTENSTT